MKYFQINVNVKSLHDSTYNKIRTLFKFFSDAEKNCLKSEPS